MTAFRSTLLLALALVFSGCFQTKTLIRLNADGSGTVEETVLMNSTMAMAVMMGGMEGMMSLDDEEPPEMPDGPYTMEALEARAEAIGATFQGVEPIEILFGGGFTATYAFDNIGDLHLTTDPSHILPEGLGDEMGMGGDEVEGEPYTFAFDDGTLTVYVPQPEAEEDLEDSVRDPKKDPLGDEDDMSGGPSADDFRQMGIVLRDMRFSLTVELPSAATQTNATFLDGQTLTLYDMDFGAMLSDPDAFETLQGMDLDDGPPGMSGDGLSSLAGVPGMRVETEQTVTISLR